MYLVGVALNKIEDKFLFFNYGTVAQLVERWTENPGRWRQFDPAQSHKGYVNGTIHVPAWVVCYRLWVVSTCKMWTFIREYPFQMVW